MGSKIARYQIPDDIKTVMDRHDEVNWSAVSRKAVIAYIKKHLPEEYRGLELTEAERTQA